MTNLVANGNFATGDFTDWTLGGNDSNASSPQIFIDTNAEGSSTYAAGLGSMGADGTLSQSIATTAGQTYTLSFWLQNEASGDNDFTAMWDGQPVLALTNASAFGYTEYTFTVTALGSTSTLEFSAANGPSQWNLDNISLTAGSSTAAPAAPAISTGAENSNQSVTLTGSAPDGATVTVWDGATAIGATSASSTGAWSLTTPDLSLGSYAFTATDATSAGSSAASGPFDVMVTTLPAPPAISTGVENSNQSVTMTGTAPDGATVTVSTLTTSDGVTTALGTTTASSTGAWSFTTTALSAGSYDFTATDTTSAGTSSASSPFVVGVSSTNPDPVTYYVSSEIGSDNNAGTSATAPLASLQAAEDLVKPGDTVEVMNGTYTGNAPGGGDVLDITTSGTASAPITFEAAPGQTPVINSSGGWNAINIEASYIVVEGFTVVGDAANYTLAQALAGYSTGNANLDGNGIAINPNGNVPNHITIENNTVYNEPGGGIYTEGADYVQILNNVVYDNAHWAAWGNSGISVSTSTNSDTNAGVHDIISGNLVFGNAQEVPTTGGSTITDGEGIILDTNPGFTGEILVENNTVYNNGSSGIESFLTDNAVITGNTVYGNNTENVQAASDAQIFINQSNNDTVTSNTTTAPSSTPPAAPVISTGAANSNESVTLTGTAPDGSTVTVSDGGATALGTATASSTGAWSFTTADLSASSYAFTATDTTSAGTSAASSPFDVTVTLPPPNPPAAPVISTGVANSNESVTLKGTAPDGSTVTVSDGGATALGTATASSTGAWSFTTADLAAGSYAFTATDTTSAGTSAASSPFDLTVTSSSPPPPSGSNLVANGNFATGNFTDWTLGGNDSNASAPQLFIDMNAEGGSTYAVGMGSMGADGTLSQTIATTAGQTYTLSFWLQNEGSGGNDFAAIWNGQTLLSLTNAAQSGYTEYTYTVTATGSTTTLEFSAANNPSQWDLDNISLTANGTSSTTPPPAAPVISSGVENSNESVTLTGTAPDGSTVTVSDGGATALGTATASSTGAWSFTTADLAASSYAFTATDTTSAGTSAASGAFDITVSSSSPPPFSATWNEIDRGDPVAMAAGDFEGLGSAQLVASETGGGTYIYVPSSATWTKIDGGVYSLMTAGDFYGTSNGNANNADLAAYDPGGGTYIWAANVGWTKIGSSTVSALAAGAFNGGSSATELVASESGAGTYLWANGFGWTKIDGGVYSIMAAGDFYGASNGNANNTDLAAYDPGVGTYIWQSGYGWSKIDSGAPTELVAGDFLGTSDGNNNESDLAAYFPGYGTYIWSASAGWDKIDNGAASSLAAVDLNGNGQNELLAYFPNYGMYEWQSGVGWNKYDSTSALPTSAQQPLFAEGNFQGGSIVDAAVGFNGTAGVWLDPPSQSSTSAAPAPVAVDNGVTVDLSGPSFAAVTYAGASGTLQLDQSASFTGTISGFGGQDQLDLTDIAFSPNTTLGYSANSDNTGGVLSVSDGVIAAHVALLGNYMASSFVTASDGRGGTLISEATQASGQTTLLAQPHAST